MNCSCPHLAAAALLLGLVAGAHGAEPADTPVSVDTLKRTYLDCDRQASRRRLDFGEAATCSAAAEQLLRRGFDGDFDQLLAWWRTARQAEAPGPTEPARG